MMTYSTAEAAEYLRQQWGHREAPSTLTKKRSIGGGPEYHRVGGRIRYTAQALDAYATDRLGRSFSSVTEERATGRKVPFEWKLNQSFR